MALLPGMSVNRDFFSHQGLSFGGLILSPKVKSIHLEMIFNKIIEYLHLCGFHRIWYRPQPFWYYPSADHYFLFKSGSKVVNTDLSYVIDLRSPLNFNSNRKRSLKKVTRLHIQKSGDLRNFHNMLATELSDKYDSKPLHTIEELVYLTEQFPEHIQLFCAELNNNSVGYILIFLFDKVVKCQYIISDERGIETEAITQIISFLYKEYNESYNYLDLGTASTSSGLLNQNLVRFKESLGGKPMPILTFEFTF